MRSVYRQDTCTRSVKEWWMSRRKPPTVDFPKGIVMDGVGPKHNAKASIPFLGQ
jgi:hypothetical protein